MIVFCMVWVFADNIIGKIGFDRLCHVQLENVMPCIGCDSESNAFEAYMSHNEATLIDQ